jgi:hypothetical protein
VAVPEFFRNLTICPSLILPHLDKGLFLHHVHILMQQVNDIID